MNKISRRCFIGISCSTLYMGSSLVAISSLLSCRQSYTRVASEINLGEVRDLLYSQQLVRERDILVNRDPLGWSAMSTQCTVEGCALSYQDERFLCVCCGSIFDHSGSVKKGPAEIPLPYYELKYLEGNLIANSGKIVPSSYRFMSPQIKEAIARLEERIKKEGTRAGTQIPEILLGKGDRTETGPMFEERKAPSREPSSDAGGSDLFP